MALSVGGSAAFNQTSLTKRLAGKRANVSAYIERHRARGSSGDASAKDIETLFQLAWLRHHPAARRHQRVRRAAQPGARRAAQPRRTIRADLPRYGHRSRWRSTIRGSASSPPELFDSVDVQRALAVYRERFADAGSFTYFLVGSLLPGLGSSARRALSRLAAGAGSGRSRRRMSASVRRRASSSARCAPASSPRRRACSSSPGPASTASRTAP